jgi:hypothetical protein
MVVPAPRDDAAPREDRRRDRALQVKKVLLIPPPQVRHMKRLLRFLGRLHLYLATRRHRQDGARIGVREHAQIDEDVDWQHQAGERTRTQGDAPSSQWFRH